MDINKEISDCLTNIDNAIAEYRSKWATKPKHIVLDIAHRQAIKLSYPNSYGGGLDPRAFGGIEIIKKEDVIILE